MKKLLALTLLVSIFTLSACGGNQSSDDAEPCSKGTETQQELCNDFKSTSLLGHQVLLDLELHKNTDGDETYMYMDVLRQHKSFYDALIDPFEEGYITFDDNGITFEDGAYGSIYVIYNDGANEEIRKMFSTNVIDLTEGETISTPAFGGFTFNTDELTVNFYTHNEKYFTIEYIHGDHFISHTHFINRWYDFDYMGIANVHVEVTSLGYNVEITEDYMTEESTVHAYEVLHSANMKPEDSTPTLPLEFEDNTTHFVQNTEYIIYIEDHQFNDGADEVTGTLVIELNDDEVLRHAFTLNRDEMNFTYVTEDEEYFISLDKGETRKLSLFISKVMQPMQDYYYVIIE